MKVNIFTDKNLAIHLAKGWSAEKLVSGQIKTLTGRSFQIQGLDPSSTVLDLKRLIEDKEGIDIKNQELLKGKTKLDNLKTLNYYFVVDGDESPTTESTKTRTAPTGSKVIVLDPEGFYMLRKPSFSTRYTMTSTKLESWKSEIARSGRQHLLSAGVDRPQRPNPGLDPTAQNLELRKEVHSVPALIQIGPGVQRGHAAQGVQEGGLILPQGSQEEPLQQGGQVLQQNTNKLNEKDENEKRMIRLRAIEQRLKSSSSSNPNNNNKKE